MSKASDGLSWPVLAAIYVGVAAATLPAVLPVMVGVLVDQLGFGLTQAGYVASANMGGVALGSIVGSGLARRLSWTAIIRGGVAAMIASNVLTMVGSAFMYVAVMRFTSGLGEGLVAGICYTVMGQCRQPTRALALYVAGQGVVGAVGMGFIPAVVARAGWPTLFVLISVLALPAFGLARTIGSLNRSSNQTILAPTARNVTGSGWSALATMLVLFIGLSAMWAFLERVGHAKGIDSFHLSLALSASSIANMIGSLTVAALARRVSRLNGFAIGLALLLASTGVGAVWDTWQAYIVVAVLFFVSWAVYFPFQFGLLADVDPGGTLAGVMPAVTGAGLTIGPALGGMLLATAGTRALSEFGLACVLASTLSAVVLHLRSIATSETA